MKNKLNKNENFYISDNVLSLRSNDFSFKLKFYHKVSKNLFYNIIQFDENIKLNKVKYLLYHNESKCYCSFDNCGCWFSDTFNIKRVGKNKFSYKQNFSRNY